jgi:hypothetical protein
MSDLDVNNKTRKREKEIFERLSVVKKERICDIWS